MENVSKNTINPFDLSKNTTAQLFEYYFRLNESKKRIERGEILADEPYAEKVRVIDNHNKKIEELTKFIKENR
jgi:hypothetical protein